MKLVWSPETASKAYIDTIKSCNTLKEPGEAELISAMAGGWNPKLIVEAYYYGGEIATSVGLTVASRYTSGRHVCMVSDERSKIRYVNDMNAIGVAPPQVVVGEVEEIMVGLVGIDFLVVDGRRKDFARVVRFAKLSHGGAVLVCTNSSQRIMAGFRWSPVLGPTTRVVRSVVLPVGKGLDIAYVANNGGTTSSPKSNSRWIKLIDHESGEEHVIRG